MRKHSLQFRVLKWIPRVLMLGVIGFSVFVYFSYSRDKELREKSAPTRPARVKQETEGINYSHFDQAKLVYHVNAKKAVKHRSNAQILEDPEFIFYDNDQKETIRITGKKCNISKDFNIIIISDDTEVTSYNGVSIKTHHIKYDARLRQFSTNSPARFDWKTMKGRAKGFVYKADNDLLILPEKPEIRYQNPSDENKRPVVVNGESGAIDRKNGFAYFDGNVEVNQGRDKITANRIELTFKPGGNDVEQITALENVHVRFGRGNQAEGSAPAPGQQTVDPKTVTPSISNVFVAEETSAKELDAQTVHLYFYEDGSTIRSFHATGDCNFVLHNFGRDGRLTENRIIKGDQFDATFDKNGDMEDFRALENVVVRVQPMGPGREDRTPQVIHCTNLLATFHPSTGDVKEIHFNEQFEHVQGKRIVTSERAVYSGASKKTDLIGKPEIRDASFTITAKEMELYEQNSGIVAKGDVKSTFVRTEGKTPNTFPFSSPSNQPVYISAEKMEWDSQKSEATYTDKAKLWQEKNVITANTIVINDKDKTLSAYEKVHTIFYNDDGKQEQQPKRRKGKANAVAATATAQSQPAQSQPAEQTAEKDDHKIIFDQDTTEKGPISVDAGIMNYVEKDRIVHFEREVKIVTPSTRIQADKSDFYLKDQGSEFDRLYAFGKVEIANDKKRGTGRQAVFYSDDRKLVLEGSPRLKEPGKADVVGRVLTLFLADGRIVIDGKEDGRATTTLAVEGTPNPTSKPSKKNAPDAGFKNGKPNEKL